jgi:hypothetical protein
VFSFLLQAFLGWWARTGYPEELPTEEAISSGQRQLVAAALAPRMDVLALFAVHDAVAAYAVPDGEKQALREKLLAESVAPPCEDPAVKHVMEVMQEIWAELEDDGMWRGNSHGMRRGNTAQPVIDSLKELLPCNEANNPGWRLMTVLDILFMGAVLISLSPSAAKAYVDGDRILAKLGCHFNADRQRATLRWAARMWDRDVKELLPDSYGYVYRSYPREVARALLPEEHIVRRVLMHPNGEGWRWNFEVRAQAT